MAQGRVGIDKPEQVQKVNGSLPTIVHLSIVLVECIYIESSKTIDGILERAAEARKAGGADMGIAVEIDEETVIAKSASMKSQWRMGKASFGMRSGAATKWCVTSQKPR